MAIRVKVRMNRMAGVGFHPPKSAAQPSLSLRCSPHCPATHEFGAVSYLPRRIPLGTQQAIFFTTCTVSRSFRGCVWNGILESHKPVRNRTLGATVGASQYPGGFQSRGPCPMLPPCADPFDCISS